MKVVGTQELLWPDVYGIMANIDQMKLKINNTTCTALSWRSVERAVRRRKDEESNTADQIAK